MQLDGQYAGFTVEWRDPGILWVRFERPEGTFNGQTAAMKRDLVELLYAAQVHRESRVVVFTGSGNAFSAGDDVKHHYDPEHWEDARTNDIFGHRRLDQVGLYGRLRAGSQRLTTALRDIDLITIAAINGICIQSAFTLALGCDFRIAARSAKIGSATLRFGFLPDENGHFLLVQHLGVARTLDFLMNNRMITGEEALDWGLVTEAVESEELEARAMEMAVKFANGPQTAMRLLKRAVYNAAESNFQQAADDIATKTAVSDHDPDAVEGVRAWVEKRAPRFNQGSYDAGSHYRPGVGIVDE